MSSSDRRLKPSGWCKGYFVPFKSPDQREVERINRLQQERFDPLVDAFEPPLPPGVPERLKQIVAAAEIEAGEVALDVGSGTGILIPLIRAFRPGRIIACDLSSKMLARLQSNYAGVETLQSDVRDVGLPQSSVDVVFINASYPNIADKAGAFSNLSRMAKPGGRLIISHPLGRQFVQILKQSAPYPLDEFPTRSEVQDLFAPYGFEIASLVDERALYILVLKTVLGASPLAMTM